MKKNPSFRSGAGASDPDQGYAQGEHDLRAEFRQCRARQQRGQSALLDALRLLDRPGGGFDGRFGIYGRQLHGRQRSQKLHLFLSGRFGGGYSRIRLDDVQIPACGDRPCGNQRLFIAQNLKPIPYRVYAFEDKNNQIYEPSVDQVGFLTERTTPPSCPTSASGTTRSAAT